MVSVTISDQVLVPHGDLIFTFEPLSNLHSDNMLRLNSLNVRSPLEIRVRDLVRNGD